MKIDVTIFLFVLPTLLLVYAIFGEYTKKIKISTIVLSVINLLTVCALYVMQLKDVVNSNITLFLSILWDVTGWLLVGVMLLSVIKTWKKVIKLVKENRKNP
ncbi:hypothetical protein bcgnr5390_61620 [Bacillus luti]|nr:hypothetical protein BC2903_31210 [Bacillus cereus]